MSTPILLALLAAFFVSLMRVVLRLVMQENEDSITVYMFYNLGAGLLLLGVFGLPSFANLSASAVILLLISSVVWTIGAYYDTKAFIDLGAAMNALLGAFRYVLLVIASVIFFSDPFKDTTIPGVVLISLSMLLTSNFKDSGFRRGVVYRLIALLFINGGILIDKQLTTMVPISTIVVSSYLLPGIIFALIAPKRCLAIPALIRRAGMPIIVMIPFQAIVYSSYVYAFAYGDLIATSTVFQSSIVLTFLIEVLFEKKHDNLMKRANAALGCTLGVLLVTM